MSDRGASSRRVPVYSVFPALLEAVFRGSAKLYPALSLGSIVGYAKSYRDGLLQKHYEFLDTFFDSSDELRRAFQDHGPGIILFSNYIWSLTDNVAISREVKQWDARNLTVFGGPSVPEGSRQVADFLERHQSVDVCVRGEGELTLAELLGVAASHELDASRDLSVLQSVDGAAARTPRGVVCANQRQRASHLEEFPSPYLTGSFDGEPVARWLYATVETSRGCPYHCAFCHWGGATAQKVRGFPMPRVLGEIEWVASHRIPRIYIVDANFGLLRRDVEIARAVARARERYGFPLELSVSYGQVSPARLSEMVQILTDSGVATVVNLALQTLDPATLEAVGRSHVTTKWVNEVVDMFHARDQPLCTDLLVGLPGATPEAVRNDLQFCFDNRISIFWYAVHVLPNSPMAAEGYLEKYQIEVDANGCIVSTSTFSKSDIEETIRLVTAFRLFVSFGLLKYVLWYLQLDHHLEATRVIRDLCCWPARDRKQTTPALWSDTPDGRELLGRCDRQTGQVTRSLLQAIENGQIPLPDGGWQSFYAEVREFIREQYGIPIDSGFEAALATQAAVMPVVGRELPAVIPLAHDFPAYYRERVLAGRVSTSGPKLTDFGPTRLSVEDPHRICENLKSGKIRNYGDVISWELETAMTVKNAVPFVARDAKMAAAT